MQGFDAFINKNILNVLLGTGYETFGILMYANTGVSVSHHNTYLGYLVELGFFGLFIYLLLFGLQARRILMLVHNHSLFYVLFLIPMLLTLATAGLDQKFILYFIITVIIKLSISLSLREGLR